MLKSCTIVKADQEGQGAVVAIPHLSGSPLDAVRALQQWLRASGITEGPIFRGFTKNMSLRKTGISDKMIAEIVKKYISLIGLDPSMYGAHSLRHWLCKKLPQLMVWKNVIL